MTMQVLIDPGDISAEPGSRRWCIGVHGQALLQKGKTHDAVGSMQFWLRKLRENGNFRQLADADGANFEVWEDFVQYPEPHGMGMRVDVANAIVAEKDTSRLLKDVIDSVPTLNPNGTNQHTDIERGFDIIKPSSKGGTSAEYLAARIKRDAPEIAARIDSFPSIRAAAKAAGIIKDRASLDVVRQVWGKADATERQRIADWLANESGQQEWREQSLLAAWDQASEQERVELLKAIRVEHHMLEEHLNIINDNYQAGVLQLLEKNRGDWIDELREIAAEQVIDKQMSWQDVLDLVKETGFGAAVDAFSQVAHEDSARRREQAVATQVEPEPKPQAPKRRRNKG